MTISIACDDEHETVEHGRISGSGHRLLSRAALACVALVCAWTGWSHVLRGNEQVVEEVPNPSAQSAPILPSGARSSIAAHAYAKLATALRNDMHRAAVAALDTEAMLFDARFSLGFPPGTFAPAVAVKGDREPLITASLGEAAPAPAPAPAQAAAAVPSLRERVMAKAASAARYLRPQNRSAALHDDSRAPDAQHTAGIFERLFGKPSPLTLAYAAPDDGGLISGPNVTGGRYDQYTAVYDISAHMVYLPDGTQLEAHSGLGALLDDPRYVDQRMRGATPPALYDLKLRESPFHGVQAIRLTPVNESEVYRRSGLLAHTYMLGPTGASNGCVSFRNYNAFLQAYLAQKIKRLAVVTHL